MRCQQITFISTQEYHRAAVFFGEHLVQFLDVFGILTDYSQFLTIIDNDIRCHSIKKNHTLIEFLRLFPYTQMYAIGPLLDADHIVYPVQHIKKGFNFKYIINPAGNFFRKRIGTFLPAQAFLFKQFKAINIPVISFITAKGKLHLIAVDLLISGCINIGRDYDLIPHSLQFLGLSLQQQGIPA